MARNRSDTPAIARPGTPGVPLRAIRRLAGEIAEKFRPEKIILFGSHAYGTPREDSDVDLLVIMPTRDPFALAVRIRLAIERAVFPIDLIVRTPGEMAWRLEEGDWFLREVVDRGKVLYEATHEGVGAEGGRGLARRGRAGRGLGGAS